MLGGTLLVVLGTCLVVSAGKSPHADLVEELVRNYPEYRYSDNVVEDGMLDVPELIAKYGYPVEVHNPVTEDGYILGLQRIPHGRDANNVPASNKPVALLVHGLFSSSADYVIMGPGNALAYLLAEEGYDVWLGNARGTFYSRRHEFLDPDSPRENDYWKFSWDEIGRIDVPTMIDYILEVTGQEKLHYIGHSQGTTSFFVLGTIRPEYNDKIISMQALAPVAYLAHNSNPLFRIISPIANQIEALVYYLGGGELLPQNNLYAGFGNEYCSDGSPFQTLCSHMLFLFGGYNPAQHNATILPAILGHAPAGAAVRQIAHYGQSIAGKEFRRYDYGNPISNYLHYRSFTPPHYDLSLITAPVFLHYSDIDVFAHIYDVERLHRELGRSMGMIRVNDPLFSHIDFIWAIDAKTLLYDNVIEYMKLMDSQN